MVSERLVCETAKSSRHLRIVEPGLLESIISPAILRASTSLRLGDTDIKRFLPVCTLLKGRNIKLYRFLALNYEYQDNAYDNSHTAHYRLNCGFFMEECKPCQCCKQR